MKWKDVRPGDTVVYLARAEVTDVRSATLMEIHRDGTTTWLGDNGRTWKGSQLLDVPVPSVYEIIKRQPT